MSNRAIYVNRAPGRLDLTIPVAGALNKHVSLPIHPRLTEEAVEYVAKSIRELA